MCKIGYTIELTAVLEGRGSGERKKTDSWLVWKMTGVTFCDSRVTTSWISPCPHSFSLEWPRHYHPACRRLPKNPRLPGSRISSLSFITRKTGFLTLSGNSSATTMSQGPQPTRYTATKVCFLSFFYIVANPDCYRSSYCVCPSTSQLPNPLFFVSSKWRLLSVTLFFFTLRPSRVCSVPWSCRTPFSSHSPHSFSLPCCLSFRHHCSAFHGTTHISPPHLLHESNNIFQ